MARILFLLLLLYIRFYIRLIPLSTSCSRSISIESKGWEGKEQVEWIEDKHYNSSVPEYAWQSRYPMPIPPSSSRSQPLPQGCMGVQGMGVQRHLSFRAQAKIIVETLSCVLSLNGPPFG